MMANTNKQISYLGKVFSGEWSGSVDESIVSLIRNGYYRTIDRDDVIRQVYQVVKKGGLDISKIYAYWFERLANDCKIHRCK